MRRRYVQVDGVLYERGTEPLPEAHQVMPDIKPYTSMITGEEIGSRAAHREHLRRHGCVEVGNEVQAQLTHYERAGAAVRESQRRSAKELIVAQVSAMRNDEFRAAIKRDVDLVKWQSNR